MIKKLLAITLFASILAPSAAAAKKVWWCTPPVYNPWGGLSSPEFCEFIEL